MQDYFWQKLSEHRLSKLKVITTENIYHWPQTVHNGSNYNSETQENSAIKVIKVFYFFTDSKSFFICLFVSLETDTRHSYVAVKVEPQYPQSQINLSENELCNLPTADVEDVLILRSALKEFLTCSDTLMQPDNTNPLLVQIHSGLLAHLNPRFAVMDTLRPT